MNLMFGGKFRTDTNKQDSQFSSSPRSGGFGGGFGSSHTSHARSGGSKGFGGGGGRYQPQQVFRSPVDDHHYQTHILMGQWKGSYDQQQDGPDEDMARYYSSYKKGTSTVMKWGPGRQEPQKTSRSGSGVVGLTNTGARVAISDEMSGARTTKQVSFSGDGSRTGKLLAPPPAIGDIPMPSSGGMPPNKDSPTKKDNSSVLVTTETKGMDNVNKDCFIIPVASIDRFLPAGVTLPMDRRPSYLNVMEIDDPKLCVFLHVMTPLACATPIMESPLAKPFTIQMAVAKDIVDAIQEDKKASEGMLLVNMERDAEYPFINYFVINKGQTDPITFFENTRSTTLSKFDTNFINYRGEHLLDLYSEVATIARPPVEPSTKKPLAKTTGYIISIFRVFEGDDSEKLERNWLYWTGARMLYRYLPRKVGLRRITLHKSEAGGDKLYLLFCECTNFLDHISDATWLVPALRARLCGYTGIYRAVATF